MCRSRRAQLARRYRRGRQLHASQLAQGYLAAALSKVDLGQGRLAMPQVLQLTQCYCERARFLVTWQAVLLEEDWVVLRDMGAYVAEGGRRGENLIREYDAGMRIRLRRPLRDRARRMPAFEVPCLLDVVHFGLATAVDNVRLVLYYEQEQCCCFNLQACCKTEPAGPGLGDVPGLCCGSADAQNHG